MTSDLFQTNVTINLLLPVSPIQVYFSFRMEVKVFSLVTGDRKEGPKQMNIRVLYVAAFVMSRCTTKCPRCETTEET